MFKVNYIFMNTIILKIIVFRLIVFNEIQLHKIIFIELPLIVLIFLFLGSFSKKGVNSSFYVFNFLFSILLISIGMFYSYYGTLPTYSALENIKQLSVIEDSIINLLEWKYLLFFVDFPFYLVFLNKINKFLFKINIRMAITVIISCLIIILFNVYNGKSEGTALNQSDKMGILVYQIYLLGSDLIKQDDKIHKKEFFVRELEKNRGRDNIHLEYNGVSKDKNIIIVQMESLQNFPINKKINNYEITPNLNKLISESVYFPNTFQQIGSGNTSDAEFLVNTSIYPVGDRAMSNVLEGVEIPSLPRILNDSGYYTATFHTNDITFWNRDALYTSLGFKEAYDKSYFGVEDYLVYGASDEVLYNKTLEIIKEKNLNENVFAHIISMSNHHPFNLPKQKSNLELPKDMQNTDLGNYLNSVNYSDRALGDFIKKLKVEGLWEDSLIVVYGDHFGLNLDETNVLFEKYFGYSSSVVDTFNIPLIMKLPNQQLAGQKVQEAAGQIDIMPTILNLIGEPLSDKVLFGKDLLNTENNLNGMRFYSPEGTYFYKDTFYNPKTKELLNINTRESLDGNQAVRVNEVLDLLNLSDKYVYHLQNQPKSWYNAHELITPKKLEEHRNNFEEIAYNDVVLSKISLAQFDNFVAYEFQGSGFTDNLDVVLNGEVLNAHVVDESKIYLLEKSRELKENLNIEFKFKHLDLSSLGKSKDVNTTLLDKFSFFENWISVELDENQYWEIFNIESKDFITVRLKINEHYLAGERPYFVVKDDILLEDKNADYIDAKLYSDIYENGFLYISIPRDNRLKDVSIENMKKYFAEENYMLYMMN